MSRVLILLIIGLVCLSSLANAGIIFSKITGGTKVSVFINVPSATAASRRGTYAFRDEYNRHMLQQFSTNFDNIFAKFKIAAPFQFKIDPSSEYFLVINGDEGNKSAKWELGEENGNQDMLWAESLFENPNLARILNPSKDLVNVSNY
ncbi:hypothetical protein PPL_11909 [Heterostelium album PN500]|uniref:Uncharacterized protein n=1 Tax=Heterostelium pallidum (strain ATCC 26659 / Pp 5 / PN500) TaxID=670386 RepID=D3BUT7_HETP5|nr:hypothetical protein PPL_11909 [Heterostelium album PN500]EFA74875.1 hypothetical protein PPL_11909 [Heterostelium album PN500]|eukprot:XP_020427009.1 hypothetical protein PPL_11909 [Heterostelium album PN500]